MQEGGRRGQERSDKRQEVKQPGHQAERWVIGSKGAVFQGCTPRPVFVFEFRIAILGGEENGLSNTCVPPLAESVCA